LKRVSTMFIVLIIALMGAVTVNAQDSERLQVIATTTIIADVAQNVGGVLAEVNAIIPPGADSHTYSPSPRDIAIIADADVILVNGLFLEESLLDILDANAPVEPVVVSLGVAILAAGEDDYHDEDHEDEHHHGFEYVGVLGGDAECDVNGNHHDDHDDEHYDDHDDEHQDDHDHGPCDPHVWMNPANVMIWAENIAAAFTAADPDNAEVYAANAAAYIAELEALQVELEAIVAALPHERRVLVTNHDFLAYLAAAYDFELVGTVIPGVSTLAEVDPRTLAELVEIVREEGVSAIFGEVSIATDLAETVAAEVGHEVRVVSLYSESLSPADGPASTYIDYMRYNVRTIVEALGG
jgi:ABC-type Zn uptake system ZnuABC Zn-binding protein ZnuA